MLRNLVGHPRLLVSFALPALTCATALATESTSALPCEAAANGPDRLEISCRLDAPAALRQFRFRAHFSGGHDDTIATMTPTLDGSPLTCDAGSKTRLMGEDGDVSLECRFSLQPQAGAKHVFGVSLRWSHAEYSRIDFTPLQPSMATMRAIDQ